MNMRFGLELALVGSGLFLFVNPQPSGAALIDGLVEYWELDGNYDAGVTPEHVGTLQAKGTGLAESGFVAGKFGQGIDLESSDADNQASVVIGGDENDFDFAGADMSVSIWYTTESLYRDWQTIVAKGEGSSWRLARNSSTASRIKLSLNIIGEGKLDQQDGTWHHLVATVNAVDGNRMYVDGELVASNTGPTDLGDNTLAMQIGGNPQAVDRGWDGILDDVAIWNRPITAEEVASIWNDGTGASMASLIGAPAERFAIKAIDYSLDDDTVTLTWDSNPGDEFTVRFSSDLVDWGADLDDGIKADAGETTTRTFDLGAVELGGLEKLYFRVEEGVDQ